MSETRPFYVYEYGPPPMLVERDATVALLALLEQAVRVRAMFESAGMPLPPSLARLFGSV